MARWREGLVQRLAGRPGAGRWARAALAFGVLAAAAGVAVAGGEGESGASVLKVRLGGDAQATRIVVELTGEVRGKLIAGADPSRRVLLALPHADAPGDMAGPGAGLVKAWTVEDAGGAVRLKLDLARDAVVRRRFLLPPGDGLNVYRYVVDLEGAGAAPLASAPAARRPAKVELPIEPLVPAKKVVVIDAGHGGKDPGAHGEDRREKDLTLAAAKTLRDELNATGRYHVVLTRDTDVFVPLEERVRIARRANADLFLSLHADSLNDPTIKGATVYTISDKGVDRAAKGVFGKPDYFLNVSLPGQSAGLDPAVNRILLDLTQRETNNRSSAFAEQLIERLGERAPLLRRSHRDAGYVVLLAPDVPAVLMEMGFITNADDEHRLGDPGQRRRLMGGVAEAIDGYFEGEKRYASR